MQVLEGDRARKTGRGNCGTAGRPVSRAPCPCSCRGRPCRNSRSGHRRARVRSPAKAWRSSSSRRRCRGARGCRCGRASRRSEWRRSRRPRRRRRSRGRQPWRWSTTPGRPSPPAWTSRDRESRFSSGRCWSRSSAAGDRPSCGVARRRGMAVTPRPAELRPIRPGHQRAQGQQRRREEGKPPALVIAEPRFGGNGARSLIVAHAQRVMRSARRVNNVRVTDAKEVGVGNPAEETFYHPNTRILTKSG